MRLRLSILALLALLVIALSGCAPASSGAGTGSKDTSASAPATSAAEQAAMNTSNPDAAELLTVADIQKASDLTGLKVVTKGSSTEAMGRLNFANGNGDLVATLSLGDAVAFDQSMKGMNFSREATGTGDMCYVGPSAKVSPVLTIFAAAKGDHAVIMKTFLKTKGGTETWLSIEQLQQLTGLALGRWPS